MRFETVEGKIVLFDDNDKQCGEITYKEKENKVIVVDHTYVPDEYRGLGYAAALVSEVVAYAQRNDLKIVPLCPYVKKRFEKDEEFQKIEYCGE